MENLHSINKESKLYVLKEGSGYSCLGFEVAKNRAIALSKELNEPLRAKNLGSKKMLSEYYRLVDIARMLNKKTGFKSMSELYHPFIGLEGLRVKVEVTYNWGETERFYIGKSTGFIPCHIAIKQRNSRGGNPVLKDSIKSFRIIWK